MPPGVSFGSPQWTTAAPDSVEGQLRSQGKHWVRSTGEIAVGAYVLDILEGRLGQPQGRGAIGKVISTDYNGQPVAIVDFGRDYSVGILLSELSLVTVVPESRKAEAEKKAALRVVLDMADSSRLVGTPAEKSLRVNTEYMKGEIALAKIRQCDVRHQEERVVLTLQNGDKLTGILEMDKFRVVTSLGKLAPEFAQIDRLTFSTSQPHGFSPTAAIKMPPQPLNIDFGVWKPNPSPQTGPAAAGREGDFWNAVAVPWNNAHIEGGLKSATGDPSPVQVEMINLGGGCSSGGALSVKSPMLDTFNYPVNNRGGNSQVILHQVPPGKYDLYIYGDNPVPLYYGDYTLTVGGRSYGRKTTFQEGDSGQSTEWVEGSQYVKFAGVKVAPGDKVEILIRPGGETTVGRPIREYPDGLLDRNGPSPGLKLDEETAPTFKGAGPQHPESNSTVTWSGRHYSGPLKMGTAPGGLRHTLADAMICGLQLIPVK